MAAVYPYLEPGEVTVGTLINMSHVAPTRPLGCQAGAEAFSPTSHTRAFPVG